MKSTEIMLLERCAQSAVSYTHAPTIRGKTTKLVRSSLSPKQQKPLNELALAGHVSRHISGCPLDGETTVTYTITAKGRDALGLHARRQQPKNATPWPTDSALERESREPV